MVALMLGLNARANRLSPLELDMTLNFRGMRVLIAEDDYLLATELASAFVAANALVLGPCASLAEATHFASKTDVAVLDVDLRGETVFPLADRLMQDSIPFVFYTGFESALLPARYVDIRCLTKPMSPEATVQIVARSHQGRPQTVADLIPQLRLRARQLLPDAAAADRLLERALLQAIAAPSLLPRQQKVSPWLEDIMAVIVDTHGGSLLH